MSPARRRIPAAFLAALVALASPPLPAADAPGPAAAGPDLAVGLQAIVAKHDVPGMVVLALRGPAVAAAAAAGVRKRGAPEPIILEDRVHLGSDTKAMTATVAALLVEENALAWSSTLGGVLGAAVPAMLPAWRDVTLPQLLSHRAGLPANPKLGYRRGPAQATLAERRRAVAADVLSGPPEHPPGDTFLYSNTGYLLAGVMLEEVTGRAWEDLMRAKLFAPLAITTAGFGAPGAAGPAAAPWGHRADGTPVDPGSPAADNPPALGPAGTAHMTITDWAKFVALHLRGDAANPHHAARLLRAASFTRLHQPAPGATYAGGWGTATRPWARGGRPGDTGRVLTHGGSNTLWYCVVWVAPEIDFAALVATNQGGPAATQACDAAAGLLIRTVVRPTR